MITKDRPLHLTNKRNSTLTAELNKRMLDKQPLDTPQIQVLIYELAMRADVLRLAYGNNLNRLIEETLATPHKTQKV